jgi:hypothetical protein
MVVSVFGAVVELSRTIAMGCDSETSGGRKTKTKSKSLHAPQNPENEGIP